MIYHDSVRVIAEICSFEIYLVSGIFDESVSSVQVDAAFVVLYAVVVASGDVDDVTAEVLLGTELSIELGRVGVLDFTGKLFLGKFIGFIEFALLHEISQL